MKTIFSLAMALALCVAPGSNGTFAAQNTPWIDGTSIIQKEKARQAIRPDAVPHQPFASRLATGPRIETVPDIGDLQPFWVVDFTTFSVTGELNLNEDKVQIWGELIQTSAHAYLYADVSLALDPYLVDSMLDQFETVIYPTIGTTFGPPPDALDGDPRVTIFVSTFPGTDSGEVAVAGYFDDANQYTDAEAMGMELGHSNEREMIYVNQMFFGEDPFTGELDVLMLGIFAHEYQHLVHWGLDRDEDLWITEGCSEYAMVLCGYGSAVLQHLETFSVAPTVSLTEWVNQLETYGAVLYYMLYLDNHYGGDLTIGALANDSLNGDHSVDNFLRENYGTNFREVFRDWAMANMLDADSGPYSYAFPETPVYHRELYEMFGFHELMPVFFTQRFDALATATAATYLPIRTSEYYLFHRAASESGAPFYGYIEVDGCWDLMVTYVGLDQTGIEDPFMLETYSYTLNGEFPVQLDTTGYGEFQIPTDDEHFAIVLCNLTSHGDPATGSINMNYRLGILPGAASTIIDDLTRPAAVSDLAIESVEDDRVTLTWTAPGDDGTTGHAALYDLRYSTNPTSLSVAFDDQPRVPTVAFPGYPGSTELETCTDLPSSVTLYFQLKTIDDRGNASLSNVVSTSTGVPDTAAPGRITDLALIEAEPGALTVGWTAPGDDGYVGQASAYDLRVSLTPITDEDGFLHADPATAPSPAMAGTSQQATIDTLAAGVYWVYVTIRAEDESGNVSEISNVLEHLYFSSSFILCDPSSFTLICSAGTQPATETLTVWNAGSGTLGYTLETPPSWLSATPGFGLSDGASSPVEHAIGFHTASLSPGDYGGTITIVDPQALNHPVEISVGLSVTAPFCVITYPGAGLQWPAGTWLSVQYRIENNVTGADCYMYLRSESTRQIWNVGTSPGGNGDHVRLVKIPADLPSGFYQVGLLWLGDRATRWESPPFEVTIPIECEIYEPATGTQWPAGTLLPVRYTVTNNVTGADSYMYLRSESTGQIWNVGTSPGGNGDHMRLAKIPADLQPGSYRVGLLWLGDHATRWQSDSFEVTVPIECDIYEPAAGTQWPAGTLLPVRYRVGNNITGAKIYMYIRSESTEQIWNVGTSPGGNGDHMRMAKIPADFMPGFYRVGLLWLGDHATRWESDSFEVTNPIQCEIYEPAAGTQWPAGTSLPVRYRFENNATGANAYMYLREENTGQIWNVGTSPGSNGDHLRMARIPPDCQPGSYRVGLLWLGDHTTRWESDSFEVVAP